MTLGQKLYTVWAFFKVNLKRVFRDKTALFFTFLFPLIFLFVFGALNSSNNSVSFKVAIINKSQSPYAKQLVTQLEHQKTFKIDKDVTNFTQANEKMSRGELDSTIELPADFGAVAANQTNPSGKVVIHYTNNSQSAAQTLQSIMQSDYRALMARLLLRRRHLLSQASKTMNVA